MSNIPLNIDFQQILLHFFNVVILFAILYFLIYSPVKKFMDKRRKEYADMDNEAQEKLSEADELKKSYEEKLQAADDEIRDMKSEAVLQADEKALEIQQEAKKQADMILQKARIQAEKEREQILETTSEQVSEIAKEAASKVLFESPSEAYDSFLKKNSQ